MLKKGFTLVELLVVIVVIAILTAITFRIAASGQEQDKLHATIRRLHALESAIGGYYSAFGSYPPVRLHGSRNIFCKLNDQGIQVLNEVEEGVLDWDRVRAACLSQPMAMSYPPCPDNASRAQGFSRKMLELVDQAPELFGRDSLASVAFDGINTTGRFSDKEDEAEWTKLNLFKFGLMSFLLPRFVYMMQGQDTKLYDKFAQWGDNNNVPCRFEDGIPYEKWEDLANESWPRGGTYNPDMWKVALLPSQIMTARWVACLEGICFFYYGESSFYTTLWGVNLRMTIGPPIMDSWLGQSAFRGVSKYRKGHGPPVYSAGEQQSENNGFTQPFMPDGVTVMDGWGEEFFYYSPPPHQGYRLWSAGANGTSFPPWISETEIDNVLNAADAKLARWWKADDIVHMSN